MIYRIANKKACYFLSRPKRFGKSLTLSTLKAYFEGRKELFVGTKMETLESKWEKYPILYFDFNSAKYDSLQNFQNSLSDRLEDYETQYGLQSKSELSTRFLRLVTAVHNQTGKDVVILVDEYDKPLLNNILNPELQDLVRAELKAFYGVLKTYFNLPNNRDGEFDITNFIEDVYNGDCDGFMKRLAAFLADNSYQIVGKAELYFQNVFYLIFKLLGFYAEVERNTSDGRMDAVVKTPKHIYVFEFKLDHPAQDAIDQINSKEYALPFAADGRTLHKIGVSFSSETRRVAEWKTE